MKPAVFDNGKVISITTGIEVISFIREENEEVFLEARQLYQEEKWEELVNLKISIENINAQFGDNSLQISKEGVATIDGEPLPSSLSKVIVELFREKADIQRLVNFWNKLKQNPSNKTIQRVYEFIERNQVVLTEDGDLVLYKIVRKTDEPGVYVDVYTGKIKQSIGQTLSMPRNKVDDRDHIGCSFGFHVAAYSYLPYYGSVSSGLDTVVLCLVGPSNIIAIPQDYNLAKIRVCEYTILSENTQLTEIRQAAYNTRQESYDEDWEEDDDYWEDEE